MVEVNLYLFGKPEWEMDLEKAKAGDFKLLGENLRERLNKVSEIVTKLERIIICKSKLWPKNITGPLTKITSEARPNKNMIDPGRRNKYWGLSNNINRKCRHPSLKVLNFDSPLRG